MFCHLSPKWRRRMDFEVTHGSCWESGMTRLIDSWWRCKRPFIHSTIGNESEPFVFLCSPISKWGIDMMLNLKIYSLVWKLGKWQFEVTALVKESSGSICGLISTVVKMTWWPGWGSEVTGCTAALIKRPKGVNVFRLDLLWRDSKCSGVSLGFDHLIKLL